MRGARLLLAIVTALAVTACSRQQPTYYVMDPNTGQPVPVINQQAYTPPSMPPGASMQASEPSDSRGLFSSSPAYAQQSYAQQSYAAPAYQQPAPPASSSGERGLLNSRSRFQAFAPQPYVQQQPAMQQPYVAQYSAPQPYAQQPRYAPQPQYAPQAAPQTQQQGGGPYATAQPYGYASVPPNGGQPAYTLDSGDKLRVVVFGQDGITNSYTVDAGGNISLPLVGTVPARGYSTQQMSRMIAERLKQGYVREPHVTVDVEAYRPFFILGEVTNPGQYPYVANMTAETAIAIAGGFAPRAQKGKVEISRNAPGQQFKGDVPLGFPLRPGDTIVVKERWF
jgi:polysaccharide export outer membrane protein